MYIKKKACQRNFGRSPGSMDNRLPLIQETEHHLCKIFHLELIVLPLFSTVVPSNIYMFLSCRPLVITTFSTGLVGVENVVLTTKGLQDRNIQLLDGTTVENKGKTINSNTLIYIYIYIYIY